MCDRARGVRWSPQCERVTTRSVRGSCDSSHDEGGMDRRLTEAGRWGRLLREGEGEGGCRWVWAEVDVVG